MPSCQGATLEARIRSSWSISIWNPITDDDF
jgi:hypothetical protein